jgi:predicted acylesterase/phospholipase RssA
MQRVWKMLFFALLLFLLVYAGLIVTLLFAQPKTEPLIFEKHGGTAVVITGAAARIVQEAALLENLQKKGWLSNICFISGTSSGAINTVMLNGILEKKFTWERYHSILFNITNHDIFIRTGKSLPVNNEPLQNLLAKVVNDSLGYKSIGDLPYQSSISISAIDLLPPFSTTYRLCNLKINNESNPAFNLVETLLASTAIPILFPATRFSESFGLPNSSYVDGGFSNDHIPFEAVLQFEKFRGVGVDTLIIVSRKSDTKQGIKNEVDKFGDTDSKTFDKLSYWIDNLAMNGFIRSMKEIQKEYPELAARTFVYIPDFDENFALLDFTEMKRQYEVTASWAETHKPIPLNQYLEENTHDNKLKVMENDNSSDK